MRLGTITFDVKGALQITRVFGIEEQKNETTTWTLQLLVGPILRYFYKNGFNFM